MEKLTSEVASVVSGPQTSPAQCQHMVARKKRLCRMTVRPGRSYCGEHDFQDPVDSLASGASTEKDSRIPCPLDPKHTCYASKLEKHLLVCNARRQSTPAYISKDINASGDTTADGEGEGRVRLKDVPEEKLRAVIALVEKLYSDLVESSIVCQTECDDDPVHPAVQEDYQLEERGHNTRRHLRQTSSLLRCLEREGLVRPRTCYVELGAGKGHVSYYLSRAVEDIPSSSVVLVDRASHRHKQDNKLDPSRHRVTRVRADIRDLALAQLPDVRSAATMVALSKHLCGVATDYALRCAVAAPARGLVMATCCHHRCKASAYVARPFLEEHGITPEYFDVIMGVVSWATCGTGFSRERRSQEEQDSARKRQKTEDRTDGDQDKRKDGTNSNGDTVTKDTSLENIGRDELSESALRNDFSNGNIVGEDESDKDGSEGISASLNKDSTNENDRQAEANTSDDSRRNTNVTDVVDISGNLTERAGTEKNSNSNTAETDVRLGASAGTSAVTDVRLGLTVERRTEIGRRAKALLDYGRVVYLRGCGYDAKLCYYVDVGISPENVCIVAKK